MILLCVDSFDDIPVCCGFFRGEGKRKGPKVTGLWAGGVLGRDSRRTVGSGNLLLIVHRRRRDEVRESERDGGVATGRIQQPDY